MKRSTKVSLALVLGLLAILLAGGAAMARDDPLVGTWHSRDSGFSNLFWFVDDPIGGVYPIFYYDDATHPSVYKDTGPMLWVGFGKEVSTNVFNGSFGNYWCPDKSDGEILEQFSTNPGITTPVRFTLSYDPDMDTIMAIAHIA